MSLELCRLTMHSVTAELHVDYKLTLVAEINQSVYYYEAWHRLFVSALDAAVQGNKGWHRNCNDVVHSHQELIITSFMQHV